MAIATMMNIANALMIGRFDIGQFLRSLAIAGVSAGVIRGLNLDRMGWANETLGIDVPEGLQLAGGVQTSGMVYHVVDWGQAIVGAAGQAVVAAVVAEITGGDVGRAFLLAFAMSIVCAIASEMRYDQVTESVHSEVICSKNKEVCYPNFTVDNDGRIQIGGVRLNVANLCEEQEPGRCNVSEILYDENGVPHRIYTSDTTSLERALATRDSCGIMGCSQAFRDGRIFSLPYDKDGDTLWDRFADRMVEAYSGPHDWGNDVIGNAYGPTAWGVLNPSQGYSFWIEFVNIMNIALFTPFAFSNIVTPDLQVWLNHYHESVKEN